MRQQTCSMQLPAQLQETYLARRGFYHQGLFGTDKMETFYACTDALC